MEKIEKLELPINDPERGVFNSGASDIQIIWKINEIIDYLNTRDSITTDGTLYRNMKRELDSFKWKESKGTIVELMVCTKHGKTICEECIQGGEWDKRMVHIEPKSETLVESVERKYNIDLGVDKETKLEELLKQKGLPVMSEILKKTSEEDEVTLLDVYRRNGLNTMLKWLDKDTPEEWEWEFTEILHHKYNPLEVSQIIYKIKELLEEREDKAREEGIRYALSEVQDRVGVQNEEVYVLCNAILQESLILKDK